MNPITPENIHRHELIGMQVEIITATDDQLVGIKGSVIDETQHILIIEPITKTTPVKIQKKICTFRFTLPSGEDVDVEGRLLNSKSENRIKNVIRKRW